MQIEGKVHLLFEQSAVFRDEFRKLGYDAQCYDIQNNFGKTDHQIDLFEEIEVSYKERERERDGLRPLRSKRSHSCIFPLHIL